MNNGNNENKVNSNKFLIIMAIISIALLGYGIFSTISENKKKETYTKIEAEIVDFVENYNSENNSSTYCAIVEYEVNDKKYTLTSKSCGASKPELGKKELIYYNPEDPNDALLDKDSSKIVIIFGVIFLAATIIFKFTYDKHNKLLKNIVPDNKCKNIKDIHMPKEYR